MVSEQPAAISRMVMFKKLSGEAATCGVWVSDQIALHWHLGGCL